MQSSNSSKGKSRMVNSKGDPLVSQRPSQPKKLNDKEITNLYKTNRIFQNIIDMPAEDMTREWISFEDTKKSIVEDILNKLNDLDAKPKFNDMIQFERLRGDGFVSLGVTQSGEYTLQERLNPKQLKDIDYIHAFSRQKVSEADVVDDVFDENHGDIENYKINLDSSPTKVNHSRILHYQTRTVENEIFGIPLIQSLYDPLTIFDNIAWSTGQVAYALVFKVLKTDNINLGNTEDYKKMQKWYEKEFNTNSLAVIGKEDELTHESPAGNLGALEDIYGFAWEYLAASARMPKSHILGQQQGTITGGQFDSLNYYARIAGLQENFLRPLLERLIDYLFWANDSGVGPGRVDPEGKYKMKFNPLWKLDKKTDAEIRETISKVDKTYIEAGVRTSDEVREERFDENGLMSKLDSLDMGQEEWQELGRRVDEARKDFEEGNNNG
jgi:phage-related protein (TIGR01555 family)